MKIAVLFHRLGPYHQARLRALARRCEVVFIQYSAVDDTYAWDDVDPEDDVYRTVTLFPQAGVEGRPAREISDVMGQALRRAAPDVVAIPGWSSPASLAALAWCGAEGVPSVLMADTFEPERPRPWKEWIKARIVANFSTALVAGKPHVEYLVKLGAPRDRVFTGYDVVDNAYFASRTADVRGNADSLRAELRLPRRYFLASGRFIPEKNLGRLLEAYSAYVAREGEGSWDLVLLGDGPLKPALDGQVASSGLGERVHFPGFKQYGELPLYYGLASAFVHASIRDTWGLVVNEAMASGLPVLVSDRCGCAPDLVRQGVNGFIFDPHDVDRLAALMAQVSGAPHRLEAMGRASRTFIESWSPDTFAENLCRAAERAASAPGRRIGAFDRALMAASARR